MHESWVKDNLISTWDLAYAQPGLKLDAGNDRSNIHHVQFGKEIVLVYANVFTLFATPLKTMLKINPDNLVTHQVSFQYILQ